MVVACTRTSGHAIGGRSFAVVHRHDANAAPAHVVLPSVTLDHLRAGNGCRAKPTRRCRWARPTYGRRSGGTPGRPPCVAFKASVFCPVCKTEVVSITRNESTTCRRPPAVRATDHTPRTDAHSHTHTSQSQLTQRSHTIHTITSNINHRLIQT
jgi:hypothetical protein